MSPMVERHPLSPFWLPGFREDTEDSDPIVLQKPMLTFSRTAAEIIASGLAWFCLRLPGLSPTS